MRALATWIIAFFFIGCAAETSSSLGFELDAITPDFSDNENAVSVEITGRYFHPKVSQQLESGGRLKIDESFAVVLVPGDGSRSPFSLEQVTYIDKKALSGKVPEGVAIGMYDVVVTDPYGATATLYDGYAVAECRENEHCGGATPWCNPKTGRCEECLADAGCSSADNWVDEDWSYRRKIVFDNRAQNENLLAFPVYISLDDSWFDFGHALPDGADIRFVDADGVTELFYEIDQWQEEAYAHLWVNVPQINAGSDQDHIWMYYGNEEAAAVDNGKQTWNSDYEAVYHFADNAAADSTSNKYDGTPHGVTWVAAVVGSGCDFGGADYIALASDLPLLMDTNGGTLSAWIYPTGVSNELYFVSISVNNGGVPTQDSRAVLGLWNGVQITAGGNTQDSGELVHLETGTVISPIAWQYVAATLDYDNGMIDIYRDSEHVAFAAVDFVSQSTPDTVVTSAVIGADDDGQDGFFKGIMDEVRISRTARSASWIKAQYLSMTDGFVQFGDEQDVP